MGVTTLRFSRPAEGDAEAGSFDVQVWYPGARSDDRAPYGTGAPGFKRFAYHQILRTHAARDSALAAPAKRFPVLVYVAGWGGQRTDNTNLAENLASAGFVVAALSDLAYDVPPCRGSRTRSIFPPKRHTQRRWRPRARGSGPKPPALHACSTNCSAWMPAIRRGGSRIGSRSSGGHSGIFVRRSGRTGGVRTRLALRCRRQSRRLALRGPQRATPPLPARQRRRALSGACRPRRGRSRPAPRGALHRRR